MFYIRRPDIQAEKIEYIKEVMLDIAEGENHISVVPAALSRALRFVLNP
ncbi:hypothetical protein P2R12_14955 [Cytobacillus oceanisediminis]|nr:hypothetical protein [Cytobacillus oceanisediminis]MDF2038264.1 hypothetical protein [Cytobacillus oceanisediminis]